MRLAYADPPYPGCAHLYPEKTEVDHAALIERLEAYDGWALSTNSRSLQFCLQLCPVDVRVIVWIKPGTICFPNHGTYGWEPVIVSGARPPEHALRDWLICDVEGFTFRPKPPGHILGAKPKPFCDWLFRWLGATQDDELDDLFPGSYAVSQAWAEFQRTGALNTLKKPIPRTQQKRYFTQDAMFDAGLSPLPGVNEPWDFGVEAVEAE